jgi:hypothetical protein
MEISLFDREKQLEDAVTEQKLWGIGEKLSLDVACVDR